MRDYKILVIPQKSTRLRESGLLDEGSLADFWGITSKIACTTHFSRDKIECYR